MSLNDTKVCTVCNKELPIINFYKNGNYYLTYCKDCYKHIRKGTRSRPIVDKEECGVQLRLCKECSKWLPITDYHLCRGKPRRVCKYCTSNKFKNRYNTDSIFRDRVINNSKVYITEHKEEHIRRMHNMYVARYASDETYRKSWNVRRKKRYHTDEEYRHKTLLINHNRRSVSSNKIEPGTILNKFKLFNNSCAYCGVANDIEQDHIVPLSKGGLNITENIVPACRHCNRSKGAKDMIMWYKKQPFFTEERLNKILEKDSY